MRVLAFEDSVDIEALLISGGVDLSKYEFIQYWDSQMFLARILEFSPDILMLDHYMPPTCGLDVLKALLGTQIQRPQTIIAMSSDSMANYAMMNAGADVGILKHQVPKLELWNQS